MPERKLKCVPTLKELNAYYNNFEGMKIFVKKRSGRGLGIVAQEDIPAGRVIAYYRVRTIPIDVHDYKCGHYRVGIDSKRDGVLDETLVYGIYRNIPYIGPYCNEPPHGKKMNVDLFQAGPTKRHGYKDMKFVSITEIKKGEEIFWCYGNSYSRSYSTSCSS